MKINGAATVLSVRDVDASLDYFAHVLGFAEDFRFDQYAGIQRGDCCLHLANHTNPNIGEPGTGNVYIYCDEVDNYFAEISARGAKCDDEPKDYAYGMRDFIVRDPDGNELTFGTPTDGI